MAGNEAALERVAHALLYAGDELSWYHAADDSIFKDEGFVPVAWQRLDLQPDIAELTMTAALALVASVGAGLLADRFSVGDARITHLKIDTVLALDTLNHNLDVCLTHAREQSFGGFRVACDAQSTILFDDAGQRVAHLVQVGLALRNDGDGIAGSGEINRL